MRIKLIAKYCKFSFILSGISFLSLLFLVFTFPLHKLILPLIKVLVWLAFLSGITSLVFFAFIMNKVKKISNNGGRFKKMLKQKYAQSYILKKLFPLLMFIILIGFFSKFNFISLRWKAIITTIAVVIIFLYVLNLIKCLLDEALRMIKGDRE